MGHSYYHRPDSERLQKHLYLARGCGGKVDAARFRNMTQCRHIDFPQDKYRRNSPVYYCKGGGGKTKKPRLADYRKTNKCAANEDFVDQRVHHPAEFARDVQSSGNGTVEHIGYGRSDKNNEGDIKKESPALGIRWGSVENHNKENKGQAKPGKSQDVRNIP